MDEPTDLLCGISFENQHAIVTGGTSGLGREIATTLARGGACVSILDVTETPRDENDPTTTVIDDFGGEAAFIRVDLTDAEDVESAVDEAMETFGPVDILVNNAGVNHLGRVDEVSVEGWDETIAVNLRGAFLVTKYCIESLVERRGCVVNITSGAALHGSPGYAAYGPSKAGLVNFTRQLAVDFSPEGVRVNAVAPGIVDAGMAAQELDDPETLAYKEEQTLLDRFGTPRDVANAVVYLASDAAGFVTGETLVVDGGWDA